MVNYEIWAPIMAKCRRGGELESSQYHTAWVITLYISFFVINLLLSSAPLSYCCYVGQVFTDVILKVMAEIHIWIATAGNRPVYLFFYFHKKRAEGFIVRRWVVCSWGKIIQKEKYKNWGQCLATTRNGKMRNLTSSASMLLMTISSKTTVVCAPQCKIFQIGRASCRERV